MEKSEGKVAKACPFCHRDARHDGLSSLWKCSAPFDRDDGPECPAAGYWVTLEKWNTRTESLVPAVELEKILHKAECDGIGAGVETTRKLLLGELAALVRAFDDILGCVLIDDNQHYEVMGDHFALRVMDARLALAHARTLLVGG